MLNSKTVLITGGTGSFGKSCAIYLLKKFNLKKLIIFSRDELKQFHVSNELQKLKKKTKLRFFLGDVRDKERLSLAFKKVDFVIHAAALKQITAAEYNPQECIKTNIYGAENIINAAKYCNKSKLALITLSGFDSNNTLSKLGNINIHVDSDKYNFIEMAHHIILLSIVDIFAQRLV